jgi:hypothetical protein
MSDAVFGSLVAAFPFCEHHFHISVRPISASQQPHHVFICQHEAQGDTEVVYKQEIL